MDNKGDISVNVRILEYVQANSLISTLLWKYGGAWFRLG